MRVKNPEVEAIIDDLVSSNAAARETLAALYRRAVGTSRGAMMTPALTWGSRGAVGSGFCAARSRSARSRSSPHFADTGRAHRKLPL